MSTPFGRGNRDAHQLPGFVKTALSREKLEDAYRARPEYQRHDYLTWIAQAKGPLMRDKRVRQMLDELKQGGVYMGEPWTPPAPVK